MFQNILIPIDITKESSWHSTFPYAVSQAEKFNAKLNIMTVLDLNFVKMMNLMEPDFGMEAYKDPKDFRDIYIEKIKEKLEGIVKKRIPQNIQTECFVKEGKVYTEIVSTAEKTNADLIVIKASHQSKLKDYLLGSNCSQVMRYAKCSVLIIRENA